MIERRSPPGDHLVWWLQVTVQRVVGDSCWDLGLGFLFRIRGPSSEQWGVDLRLVPG